MPIPKAPPGNVAGPPDPDPAPVVVLITYDGPIDPKDKTTAVTVPHTDRGDEHFPRGTAVQTTHSTADRLAAMAGHTFTTQPAPPEGDN